MLEGFGAGEDVAGVVLSVPRPVTTLRDDVEELSVAVAVGLLLTLPELGAGEDVAGVVLSVPRVATGTALCDDVEDVTTAGAVAAGLLLTLAGFGAGDDVAGVASLVLLLAAAPGFLFLFISPIASAEELVSKTMEEKKTDLSLDMPFSFSDR